MRSLGVTGCVAWLLIAGWTSAWSQIGDVPTTPTEIPGQAGQDLIAPELQDELLSSSARLSARTFMGPSLPGLSGPVDPAAYRLGPGDVLQLLQWGRLSSSSYMSVGPEGVVAVPGHGAIQVAGRTLAAVRVEILASLRGRFRGVNMDLRLARPRQFYVYLTGQVKRIGPAAATGADRVFDVLRESDFADDASRRMIRVKHTDGTWELADFNLFSSLGVESSNPWLRDGDVINVPIATDFVYASGALAGPGRFELGHRDSLLTLFRLAGDPIPAADASRALLIRWKDSLTPESLWVTLEDVYSRKINPLLKDGDRLYVYYVPEYHLQHEAYVYGDVSRPGPYPIREGRDHLSDLIMSAGGFQPTADLSAIRVHRPNTATREDDPELQRLLRLPAGELTPSESYTLSTKLAGLRDDYRVDWHRLQQHQGDLDLLLRDGDIVRVERVLNSVRVDGAVRRPGILSFRPGLRVSDYIEQAGGFTKRAWRSRVRVSRAVTGQTLPVGDVGSLDPGDFVWVPERREWSPWELAQTILPPVAQLATVVVAIRSIVRK